MHTGNTELLRSFYVVVLAVVAATTAILSHDVFIPAGIALIIGFPLLAFLIAAGFFRHYGKIDKFSTQKYSRVLLSVAMVIAVVGATIPVARLAL